MVINSLIIRYDEIMRLYDKRIDRKFDHDELLEMIECAAATPDGPKRLCRIDRSFHNEDMVKLIASAELEASDRHLSSAKQRELVRILGKNLSTLDLLALADRLSVVLAHRASKVDG